MIMSNNAQQRVTNQSFEQNKQQIQQTHDIINVIENKLNNFLQKRGVKQTSPDTYKLSVQQSYRDTYSPEGMIENKMQQMETTMEGRTYKLQQNIDIHQENKALKQSVRQIELAYNGQIEEQLDQQRQQLQKQFEIQVNDIGENAKNRLLKILEQEEKYLSQYNRVVEDKSHLQNQLDQLKIKNKGLQDERDDLISSYSNLLQMHNQMIKIDVTQNQSQIDNYRIKDQIVTNNDNPYAENSSKVQLMDTLNQYKDELDQLKNVNENIQEHMSKELQDLRDELERQKSENADLIREMSSLKVSEHSGRQTYSENKDLNDLYKQVFKPNTLPIKYNQQIICDEEEDEDSSDSQVESTKPLPSSGRKKRQIRQQVQKQQKVNMNLAQSPRSKSKSKSKSQKRHDGKVNAQKIVKSDLQKSSQISHQPVDNQLRIKKFEKELNRLKDIVNDKIVNKRRRKQGNDIDE